jgi:hypothetical protein
MQVQRKLIHNTMDVVVGILLKLNNINELN